MKIKFICVAVRWFDRVNGNTYHSVRVTRCRDNKVIAVEWQYGYGDQYRYTATEAMLKAGWLPKKYNADNYYLYERENDYPIYWDCRDGLKREMLANGVL